MSPLDLATDRSRRRRRPILVLPGLAATDRSTLPLRANLRSLGHRVDGWRLGRNEGPTEETLTALDARFRELSDRYDRPIGIVGWSLGGAYAWALAGRHPERVRSVVALGSPLKGLDEIVSPPPPSVPVTSIWSRLDDVVPQQYSTLPQARRRENIEVRALHVTLGFDPVVMAIIADRVVASKQRWTPYAPPRCLTPVLPRTPAGV